MANSPKVESVAGGWATFGSDIGFDQIDDKENKFDSTLFDDFRQGIDKAPVSATWNAEKSSMGGLLDEGIDEADNESESIYFAFSRHNQKAESPDISDKPTGSWESQSGDDSPSVSEKPTGSWASPTSSTADSPKFVPEKSHAAADNALANATSWLSVDSIEDDKTIDNFLAKVVKLPPLYGASQSEVHELNEFIKMISEVFNASKRCGSAVDKERIRKAAERVGLSLDVVDAVLEQTVDQQFNLTRRNRTRSDRALARAIREKKPAGSGKKLITEEERVDDFIRRLSILTTVQRIFQARDKALAAKENLKSIFVNEQRTEETDSQENAEYSASRSRMRGIVEPVENAVNRTAASDEYRESIGDMSGSGSNAHQEDEGNPLYIPRTEQNGSEVEVRAKDEPHYERPETEVFNVDHVRSRARDNSGMTSRPPGKDSDSSAPESRLDVNERHYPFTPALRSPESRVVHHGVAVPREFRDTKSSGRVQKSWNRSYVSSEEENDAEALPSLNQAHAVDNRDRQSPSLPQSPSLLTQGEHERFSLDDNDACFETPTGPNISADVDDRTHALRRWDSEHTSRTMKYSDDVSHASAAMGGHLAINDAGSIKGEESTRQDRANDRKETDLSGAQIINMKNATLPLKDKTRNPRFNEEHYTSHAMPYSDDVSHASAAMGGHVAVNDAGSIEGQERPRQGRANDRKETDLSGAQVVNMRNATLSLKGKSRNQRFNEEHRADFASPALSMHATTTSPSEETEHEAEIVDDDCSGGGSLCSTSIQERAAKWESLAKKRQKHQARKSHTSKNDAGTDATAQSSSEPSNTQCSSPLIQISSEDDNERVDAFLANLVRLAPAEGSSVSELNQLRNLIKGSEPTLEVEEWSAEEKDGLREAAKLVGLPEQIVEVAIADAEELHLQHSASSEGALTRIRNERSLIENDMEGFPWSMENLESMSASIAPGNLESMSVGTGNLGGMSVGPENLERTSTGPNSPGVVLSNDPAPVRKQSSDPPVGSSAQEIHLLNRLVQMASPVFEGAKPTILEEARIRQTAQLAGVPLDIIDRVLDQADEEEQVLRSRTGISSAAPSFTASSMEAVNEDDRIEEFLKSKGRDMLVGSVFPASSGNARKGKMILSPRTLARYFPPPEGASQDDIAMLNRFIGVVAPVFKGARPSVIEEAEIRQRAVAADLPLDYVDRMLEKATGLIKSYSSDSESCYDCEEKDDAPSECDGSTPGPTISAYSTFASFSDEEDKTQNVQIVSESGDLRFDIGAPSDSSSYSESSDDRNSWWGDLGLGSGDKSKTMLDQMLNLLGPTLSHDDSQTIATEVTEQSTSFGASTLRTCSFTRSASRNDSRTIFTTDTSTKTGFPLLCGGIRVTLTDDKTTSS